MKNEKKLNTSKHNISSIINNYDIQVNPIDLGIMNNSMFTNLYINLYFPKYFNAVLFIR